MLKFQFFGYEPILIDKAIFYTERNGGGKYVYEPAEVRQLINGYKINDTEALDQILREIFWICDQGRRPWSLEAEQSFTDIASVGHDLLNYLRSVGAVHNETYEFIDPLKMALRLEREAEHLQEIDSRADAGRWGNTIKIFDQLIGIYISIFDYWSSDYPNNTKLPEINDMIYLLETGDDSDFEVLLTSFAKTRSPSVKQVLVEFSRDDEQHVANLAGKLFAMYF